MVDVVDILIEIQLSPVITKIYESFVSPARSEGVSFTSLFRGIGNCKMARACVESCGAGGSFHFGTQNITAVTHYRYRYCIPLAS
jgi:hypothetical protein